MEVRISFGSVGALAALGDEGGCCCCWWGGRAGVGKCGWIRSLKKDFKGVLLVPLLVLKAAGQGGGGERMRLRLRVVLVGGCSGGRMRRGFFGRRGTLLEGHAPGGRKGSFFLVRSCRSCGADAAAKDRNPRSSPPPPPSRNKPPPRWLFVSAPSQRGIPQKRCSE